MFMNMNKKRNNNEIRLPQIITSNLNETIVNRVFDLLNMIESSRVMNEKMKEFQICLDDNDDGTRDDNIIIKQTISLNNSYSKLDLLQKKILNRTFEIAIMGDTGIEDVKRKYISEIELLIKKVELHHVRTGMV